MWRPVALLHTFNDPTVTTEDSFGWSVSLMGEQVLIGDLATTLMGLMLDKYMRLMQPRGSSCERSMIRPSRSRTVSVFQ